MTKGNKGDFKHISPSIYTTVFDANKPTQTMYSFKIIRICKSMLHNCLFVCLLVYSFIYLFLSLFRRFILSSLNAFLFAWQSANGIFVRFVYAMPFSIIMFCYFFLLLSAALHFSLCALLLSPFAPYLFLHLFLSAFYLTSRENSREIIYSFKVNRTQNQTDI